MTEVAVSSMTHPLLRTSGCDSESCGGRNDSASVCPTAAPHTHIHRSLLGVSLGFLSLLTVLMNLLVLCAVKKEKSLHTVGNLYIVSLSVADLMVGSTVMPLSLLYLLDHQWKLGRAACQFWLIMDYVASTASIFSLFILCLDRYRSVKQPLKYLKYRTRRKASAMISGAWLLSMMWIIPILGWRSFSHVELKPEEENQCDTDFRFVTWFKVITAVFNFYLPSILMLWFYSYIYSAVRQHLQDQGRNIHPTDSFEEKEQIAEERKKSHSSSKSRCCLDRNTVNQPYCLQDVEQKASAHRALGAQHQHASPDSTMTTEQLKLVQKCSGGETPERDSQPQVHEEASSKEEKKNQPSLHDTGTACDITQIPAVQMSVLLQNLDRKSLPRPQENLREGEEGSAQEVTLRRSWHRFIEQSRLRIQSLRIHKEHKAAKQLGVIVTVYLLCWIPYFIAFMVLAVCRECVHHDLHMFTIWLGYINSTLNPFIYPLCNRNFRLVFKNLLHIPL